MFFSTSLEVLRKCHGFIREREKNHRKSIISRKICINMCVGAVSKLPIGRIQTDQNRSNEPCVYAVFFVRSLFAYMHIFVRWPSLSYYRSIVLIGFHTYEINARRFHCYSVSIIISNVRDTQHWQCSAFKTKIQASLGLSLYLFVALRMDQ